MHRRLTCPTKTRRSTTTPTLTPPAAIALVPDTQSLPFVRIHASTDTRSRGSSAGVRWLASHVTGSPEPAPAYAASPTQRRNTKHKVETPKERSNCPTDVRSTQRMAERDSRRSKDPMEGQNSPTRGRSNQRGPTPVQTAELPSNAKPWARTRVTAMERQGVGPNASPCASSTPLARNSEPEVDFYGAAMLFPAPLPHGIFVPFSYLSPPSHARASRRYSTLYYKYYLLRKYKILVSGTNISCGEG